MEYQVARNEQATRLKKINRAKREIVCTAIVLPITIGFFAFTLFPMVLSLVVSFHDLHSYNMQYMEPAGWKNYEFLLGVDLRSGWMLTGLQNIARYLLNVPFWIISAIFLANIVAKKLPGSKFMRVVMFMPQVMSGVAVTMVFKWIFQEEFGMFNTMLRNLGIENPPLWQSSPDAFSGGVTILSWWMYGMNVIVMENGFLNVDKSIQEAAMVDGAGDFHVFWKITLPALTPTIFYLWTMWLVAALQEQTMFQILSGNGTGPADRGLTPVYYIYKLAFEASASRGFGVACALSWIYALLIMAITRLNFWLSKFWVSYDF
jgi:multiple sugar transport system permease protein